MAKRSKKGKKRKKRKKRKKKVDASDGCGCGPGEMGMGCCKVESVISVDDRGQMVLPKDLRAKADISPGDKLALITGEKDGKVCCIFMVKAGMFGDMVKEMLGPMMTEILKG